MLVLVLLDAVLIHKQFASDKDSALMGAKKNNFIVLSLAESGGNMIINK